MDNKRNTLFYRPFEKMARKKLWVFLFSFLTVPAFTREGAPQFAEQVNLALRRAAHQLLIENGDSVSRVPPVQQSDPLTFLLRIDSLFEYEQLPVLLKESLELHKVDRPYQVLIVHCGSGEIELGYSYLDLKKEGGVPCEGRQQQAGCYLLKLAFISDDARAGPGGKWWLFGIGGLLAGVGLMVWRKSLKVPALALENNSQVQSASDLPKFGNSAFDLSNLMLYSGNHTRRLTYREAKLLKLFADHQNKILERDFILKSVWEDEGIIVGRSIDVFVSRLRKLLQKDTSIKIAAIHGIGYRMEVKKSPV